jgi:hypothetical protein
MHALGMFIEFRPAGAPPDALHLRHIHDQAFGDQPDPVALGQRNAGVEQQVDGQRALVERRQERARQLRGKRRPPHRKATAAINVFWVAEGQTSNARLADFNARISPLS